LIHCIWPLIILASCNNNKQKEKTSNTMATKADSVDFKSGFSTVNGIKMYYETYGKGEPLVLIHGGGSTIQSTFGTIIPQLAADFSVIAVELQNHGRSGHRTVPQTFIQDADDVAALLKNLGISKASFFGFSNGGTTSMEIAIRHPEIVHKLVLAAAAFKRDGFIAGFFEGMSKATIANMPKELQSAFLEVNPDSVQLQDMFQKDRDRMIAFKDIPDEQLKSIKAPTLIITGDVDVTTNEHALTMRRLIPNSQLAIIPGGHGKCIGEITTIHDGNNDPEFVLPMIKAFLASIP